MFDKDLIEALNIRFGWSPEAVLSITEDQIKKMTDEELGKYVEAAMYLFDNTHDIENYPVVDGVVHCSSEKEWQ